MKQKPYFKLPKEFWDRLSRPVRKWRTAFPGKEQREGAGHWVTGEGEEDRGWLFGISGVRDRNHGQGEPNRAARPLGWPLAVAQGFQRSGFAGPTCTALIPGPSCSWEWLRTTSQVRETKVPLVTWGKGEFVRLGDHSLRFEGPGDGESLGRSSKRL